MPDACVVFALSACSLLVPAAVVVATGVVAVVVATVAVAVSLRQSWLPVFMCMSDIRSRHANRHGEITSAGVGVGVYGTQFHPSFKRRVPQQDRGQFHLPCYKPSAMADFFLYLIAPAGGYGGGRGGGGYGGGGNYGGGGYGGKQPYCLFEVLDWQWV